MVFARNGPRSKIAGRYHYERTAESDKPEFESDFFREILVARILGKELHRHGVPIRNSNSVQNGRQTVLHSRRSVFIVYN